MVSTVNVYCGGRRSGKTLSMSASGARALMRGEPVWSNYPIVVKKRMPSGEIATFRSTVIDMPDLLELQQRDVIKGTKSKPGHIKLDEWNLFCNARRSGALSSVVFTGVVQLIGKRHLNIDISTQDFHTLDRNIRWQCDVTINCFDLSFKYHNLPEGFVVSQRITDWTGVYTGRPISQKADPFELARNTRNRLFVRAGRYHNVYDTGFEYNVLEIFSKRYNIKKNDVYIGDVQDNGGFDMNMLTGLKEMLIYEGRDHISSDDLQKRLKEQGFQFETLSGGLGRKLKKAGFSYKRTGRENIYLLDNEVTNVAQ